MDRMPTKEEFERIDRRVRRRAWVAMWVGRVDRPLFWLLVFWTGVLFGVALRSQLDEHAWMTLAVLGLWAVWGSWRTLAVGHI